MGLARPWHFFRLTRGETPRDVSSGIAGDVADIGDETRAAARHVKCQSAFRLCFASVVLLKQSLASKKFREKILEACSRFLGVEGEACSRLSLTLVFHHY